MESVLKLKQIIIMDVLEWKKALEEIDWDAVREKLQQEFEIQDAQIKRIFPYLTEIHLDRFFEWEKNFQEKQYQRGIDTSSLLFHILTLALIPLKTQCECNENFMGDCFEYLSYRFEEYHGQGSFWKVFKNNIQVL